MEKDYVCLLEKINRNFCRFGLKRNNVNPWTSTLTKIHYYEDNQIKAKNSFESNIALASIWKWTKQNIVNQDNLRQLPYVLLIFVADFTNMDREEISLFNTCPT